ncbi:MAG: (2Fe-2S)-binding protein [Planctomycetota bacterium]
MSRSPEDPGGSDPRAARPGLSRRGFLKGAGLTVAAVSVGQSGAAGQKPAAPRFGGEEVPILGAEGAEIVLRVNGAERKVKIRPMTTLLDALRDGLELTGSKRVCDRGACGACSVHVDGKLVTSCSMLAVDAVGRELRTVEGLVGPDGALTPVQSAFVECDALQCGFCTPGMVMACTALLAENPSPTREQAAEGIAGNICRCGTYDNILDAVALAASGKVKERKR